MNINFISPGKNLRVGFLGQIVYVSFLKKLTDCFPKWLYNFAFLPVLTEDLLAPQPCLYLVLSVITIVIIYFSHSNMCKVVSHFVLNLYFPNDGDFSWACLPLIYLCRNVYSHILSIFNVCPCSYY